MQNGRPGRAVSQPACYVRTLLGRRVQQVHLSFMSPIDRPTLRAGLARAQFMIAHSMTERRNWTPGGLRKGKEALALLPSTSTTGGGPSAFSISTASLVRSSVRRRSSTFSGKPVLASLVRSLAQTIYFLTRWIIRFADCSLSLLTHSLPSAAPALLG